MLVSIDREGSEEFHDKANAAKQASICMALGINRRPEMFGWEGFYEERNAGKLFNHSVKLRCYLGNVMAFALRNSLSPFSIQQK